MYEGTCADVGVLPSIFLCVLSIQFDWIERNRVVILRVWVFDLSGVFNQRERGRQQH